MSTPSGWFQEPVRPTAYPAAHDLDPRRLAQHAYEEEHGDGHEFHLHWKSDRERKQHKLLVFLVGTIPGLILAWISLPVWYAVNPSGNVVAPLIAAAGTCEFIGWAILLTNKKMGKKKLWLVAPLFFVAAWLAGWMLLHFMQIPPIPM